MADVVPFACGIGILGLFTIYQFKLGRTLVGNYKDKMYYYNSNLITSIPMVIYSFQIIDVVNNVNQVLYLGLFYVEYLFTTALIVLNVCRFANASTRTHIFALWIDICMLLCGYISYITANTELIYSMYGVSCICYIVLMSMFVRRFRTFSNNIQNVHPPTSMYRDSLRYRIYRAIVISIMVMWTGYPITHILYKTGTISMLTTTWLYVGMDVLTKGVFTNLLLGVREIYRSPESWLGYITRMSFRVHPLANTFSENSLEYDLPRVVVTPVVEQPLPVTMDKEKRVAQVESIRIHSTYKSTTVVHVPTLDSIREEIP